MMIRALFPVEKLLTDSRKKNTYIYSKYITRSES